LVPFPLPPAPLNLDLDLDLDLDFDLDLDLDLLEPAAHELCPLLTPRTPLLFLSSISDTGEHSLPLLVSLTGDGSGLNTPEEPIRHRVAPDEVLLTTRMPQGTLPPCFLYPPCHLHPDTHGGFGALDAVFWVPLPREPGVPMFF
jgi:hypothetical protein